MSRIGFGFDTHKLQPDADLFLGGVKIPSEKGAVGHSDADVLIHAICDALLGAANLGDIGTHFPDSDEQYKGIDSKILLKKVVAILNEKNFHIANIDTTVCLEKPKIAPYIIQIQQKLSEVIGIPDYDISVKAKTSEKLGFIGREEGVSAYAVVLLD
ncbi:MAG TPA: 2-C-methyl-D-erythritol 2,4-cyclodiphosphate synthase [Bacteroidales bacterium]|nr:2-C-methyl-D-erythritol 2,4-cyclodiphosphate synthase [Bacteroidales bacterium]HPS26122.1 2-C-methyl-D-erythritol 2,4-cyclodiphosphate synthase [Bacteroidales bacterium]